MIEYGFIDTKGMSLPAQPGDEFDVIVSGSFVVDAPGISYSTSAWGSATRFSCTIVSLPARFELFLFKNIDELCNAPVSSMCDSAIESYYRDSDSLGHVCFYESPEGVLLDGAVYIDGILLQVKQRLPLERVSLAFRFEGGALYHTLSGEVVNIGSRRRRVEEVFKTDFLPESFHEQLLEILETQAVKINGLDYEFAGEYEMNLTPAGVLGKVKLVRKYNKPIKCS